MTKLTVLIPTRNRAFCLQRSLNGFLQAIRSLEKKFDGEILVVDNFSSDETEKVTREIQLCSSFVRYEKHDKKRDTAESSMAYGLQKARGEYIWVFGDDDIPHQNSLHQLLKHIKDQRDLYLINCNIKLPNERIITYLPHEKCKDYSVAKNLWLDLGFVSATTTMSSLCFKRSLFNLDIFNKYAELSEVYSHSVSLFAMFQGGNAAVIGQPLYTYSQNTSEEEARRFKDFFDKKGLSVFYPFTKGLLRLLYRVSAETGVSIQDLLNAHESEIRKDNWQMVESTTGQFIKRFCESFKKSMFDPSWRSCKISTRLKCFIEILAIEYLLDAQKNIVIRRLIVRYLLNPFGKDTLIWN